MVGMAALRFSRKALPAADSLPKIFVRPWWDGVVRREHLPQRAAIYLLPLQVDKKNNSGEPVADVSENGAHYVVPNPLSDSLGVCL